MKRILFTIAAIVAFAIGAYADDDRLDVYVHTPQEIAKQRESDANFWGQQDAAKAYWDHHDKELKGQADNYEYIMRVASFYEKSRDISPDQDVEYTAAFVHKLQEMLKADSSN